jgi:hypothetical protein
MGRPFLANKPILERFWEKVQVKGTNDCWQWTAGRQSKGYGSFHIGPNARMVCAHVISWILANKRDVPKDLELDHTCRNRICVNPKHLEPVTSQVNSQRGQGSKAECVHGHSLSGPNLVMWGGRYRRCRACISRLDREHRQRQGRC